MSYAPALDAYAFDVAVSFASEDREFVGEIVSQLTASNARVFCDSDFSAGIRGEELPGHLDRIYRRKTPHAVIFVSRFYAEKMWARYERAPLLLAHTKTREFIFLRSGLTILRSPGYARRSAVSTHAGWGSRELSRRSWGGLESCGPSVPIW